MKRFLLDFVGRHPWQALGIALFFAMVGGLAVSASGLVSIKASSGHWQITEWFLEFSKRRSVSTYALLFVPSPPKDLDDRSYALRGAGHFETGCRPCHGAPGDPLPRIPWAMTPTPPKLSETVPTWSAKELFFIVRHGIKFTGMPAWPALGREDEVWSVVSFLRLLPKLGEEGYEDLVRGGERTDLSELMGPSDAPGAPSVVAESCARCHGYAGNGRGVGAFPKLAGQRPEYLRKSLVAYAQARRHSGIMQPIALGLSPEAIDEAVTYYSSLPGFPPPDLRQPQSAGAIIVARGVPEEDIPACADCHAPGDTPVNGVYPLLAGQYREYIELQLRAMKERDRGGTPYVRIMHNFVDRLSDAQIAAVAEFFAGVEEPSSEAAAAASGAGEPGLGSRD